MRDRWGFEGSGGQLALRLGSDLHRHTQGCTPAALTVSATEVESQAAHRHLKTKSPRTARVFCMSLQNQRTDTSEYMQLNRGAHLEVSGTP